VSWLGASILPKLDSSKDLFIPREKFIVEFKSYKDQFAEFKNA
jgi:actin-related protein